MKDAVIKEWLTTLESRQISDLYRALVAAQKDGIEGFYASVLLDELNQYSGDTESA